MTILNQDTQNLSEYSDSNNFFQSVVVAKKGETYFPSLSTPLILHEKIGAHRQTCPRLRETVLEREIGGLDNPDSEMSGSYTRISMEISAPARAAIQKSGTLVFHLKMNLKWGQYSRHTVFKHF